MPQIDKITFLTIIFWVLVSYFFLYFDLSVTYFYKFLTFLKFKFKKLGLIYRKNRLNGIETRTFFNLNWIGGSNPKIPRNIVDLLVIFFTLWSVFQWLSSLVLLVLLYGWLGVVYNKAAKRWFKGYWLSWSDRLWLLLIDLSLNVFFGVLLLAFPEFFGEGIIDMLHKCPIFLSPFILGIEFICFLIYTKKQIDAKKNREKELQKEINQKLNEKKWRV